MAYSITGMRRAPDVGFKAASRQTAEGAKELAVDFLADGMQEVEVHDAEGNLLTLRDLDHARERIGAGDSRLAARLSAIG